MISPGEEASFTGVRCYSEQVGRGNEMLFFLLLALIKYYLFFALGCILEVILTGKTVEV